MAVLGGNSIDHGFAYAGMVVDAQACNGVSKLNKGATNIASGLGVVSNGDDGAALPTAASTASGFNGIVKYELNRVVGDDGVSVNTLRDMTVVTHGVVYVQPITGVAKDDSVFIVIGDGTTPNTNLGKFANVVGAGVTAAIQITDAKFTSSAVADGFAKLSLGLGG